MEWYIPITILPGVGFLILSTSNFLISLNNEIRELEKNTDLYRNTIKEKLLQLKRLNHSLIGQYISSFLLVLAGAIGELFSIDKVLELTVLLGVISLAISIILMIIYSIKSVKIRQEHLKI